VPGLTRCGLTNVGSSGHSLSKAKQSPVWQRKNASCGTKRTGRTTSAGTGGMWRFYTEDSPGLREGPVPISVMRLPFIISIFMLHIWGKYTCSWIPLHPSVCHLKKKGKNPNISWTKSIVIFCS
uniref:Uncharacterized protein n=1 Tax=Bos mutus grunniens TaxID=30521 RepID=A0A8B9X6U7_BOSMU